MTIKYKPAIDEHDLAEFTCVSFGYNTLVFKNDDDALSAFKAIKKSLGFIASYYQYEDKVVSGNLSNIVVLPQKTSLETKNAVLKDSVANLIYEQAEIHCDEPGCWRSEDYDGENIPEDWQELKQDVLKKDSDVKHFCHQHSK